MSRCGLWWVLIRSIPLLKELKIIRRIAKKFIMADTNKVLAPSEELEEIEQQVSARAADDDVEKGDAGDDEKPASSKFHMNMSNPVDMSDSQTFSFVGIFVAGMVLIIALTAKAGGGKKIFEVYDYGEYGLAIGSVAVIFAFLGWAVSQFMDGAETTQFGLKALNHFLFVWNFIGFCFMTFPLHAPFRDVGNGYFASAALVVFSVMSLGVKASAVQNAAADGAGMVFGLIAAAIVEIVALAVFMDGDNGWKGSNDDAAIIFGLVVACLTVVTCIGLVVYERKTEVDVSPMIKLVKFGLYAILWIVLACLVTFRGPFKDVQNGYFGAWFGCLAAISCAMDAKRKFSGERADI